MRLGERSCLALLLRVYLSVGGASAREQWRVARQAYSDFGRGSGHPARLNLGDCFAYALHRVTGEPLLYKGDDFAAAGVSSASAGT